MSNKTTAMEANTKVSERLGITYVKEQVMEILLGVAPKTIIFWGQDHIFLTREGGEAYLRDLPEAEMHRLDSGHFAVEDCLDYIARNIQRFFDEKVASK